MKHGKNYSNARKKMGEKLPVPLEQAVKAVKGNAYAKFDETVEVAVRLGVDPKQADQMIRGTVALPNGTGKKVRILVIAKDEKLEDARAAGADHAGNEDYLEKLKGGWADIDVIVATPDMMGKLGPLGKVLGPKGLMPNPKAGTVTADVTKAVREIKAGKIEYRVDKTGNIGVPIGKVSFTEEQLAQNAMAFLEAIIKARPASAKGTYLRNAAMSSTMGPGVKISTADILARVKTA
ncbi:MAG: 50S ribosomal protein L1 [candidate division Zixibacteria bacterium]|nr:50S ribosomal protein L1 [candidate division Zixibacteria bacterium]